MLITMGGLQFLLRVAIASNGCVQYLNHARYQCGTNQYLTHALHPVQNLFAFSHIQVSHAHTNFLFRQIKNVRRFFSQASQGCTSAALACRPAVHECSQSVEVRCQPVASTHRQHTNWLHISSTDQLHISSLDSNTPDSSSEDDCIQGWKRGQVVI